jgi:hypothetical protein
MVVKFENKTLHDLSIDARIILTEIRSLKKQAGRVSTRSVWFKMRVSGELLCNEPLRVPSNEKNFLAIWATDSFSRGILLHSIG